MIKTSTPDWFTDNVTCDCLLAMCPICDPDFYYELDRDQDFVFVPDEIETPF